MAKETNFKTNVMRILDKAKVPYQSYSYENTQAVDGVTVAKAIGKNPDQVFKTLVTVGKSKQFYIFVIPVNKELDLKKAAAIAKEKAIEMIKNKELLPTTGYIHGGCSPIGMKKNFTTTIHSSASTFGTIVFSAGKIGYQVEVGLDDLRKVISYTIEDCISDL